jgi:putative two-component system response regulator
MLAEERISSTAASSLAEAHSRISAGSYDIVLADLKLGDGTGAELTDYLGKRHPNAATILMSGSGTADVASAALADGVDDYLTKPFTRQQLAITVTRALRRRAERARSSQARGNTPDCAEQAEPHRLGEEVLDCLARAGRFRDEETAEHVERVSRSCALIGRELGLSPFECGTLRAASAMHDIGKIGIPDAVLSKPGELTAQERGLIERHAEIGHQILGGSEDPVLELAATIAATHHEWIDGSGYPDGLVGDGIPLSGRITAVADVFDALTNDRVYRKAFTVPEALEIMSDGVGSQFDTRVFEAFRAVRPQIERVGLLYPDVMTATSEEVDHPERPLRVLVVEDHGAVARGVELILRREGMEIAGTAATVAEAKRMLAGRDVDVVLLDIDLQGEDGRVLVAVAHARDARVLLYTGGTTTLTAKGPEHTPDGTASKLGGATELVTAIREVAGGNSPVDTRVDLPAPLPSRKQLTPREREITGLLATGLTGEEIAGSLFLSSHTVRTHIRNAMTRTQANTRAHLIALVTASGELAEASHP